jgi:hypothetical protein
MMASELLFGEGGLRLFDRLRRMEARQCIVLEDEDWFQDLPL